MEPGPPTIDDEPPVGADDRTPDEAALVTADLVRADVDLRVRRRHLRLLTAHDLFSGDAVDGGTTLLLRSVRKEVEAPTTVTDLGCGYGPLGLWAAAAWPDAEVRLTDRDALAVAFARANAARNDLDVAVTPTLLLDGEPTGRDLVVANVPGKAGPGALRHLVAQGLAALGPNGRLGLVAVQPIAETVVGAAVDAGAEVRHRHDNATYAVVVVAPPAGGVAPVAASFASGAYERDAAPVDLEGLEAPLRIRTVHGLPEFDTAAHATVLAWSRLRRGRMGRLLVVNPGQGFVPAAATTKSGVEVHLLSRDLLQLRATLRALGDAGAGDRVRSATHAVPALVTPPPCDTAVVLAGRRDRPAEVGVLLRALAEGGATRVVLAGRSRLVTDVGRLVRRERTWWSGEEDVHHGASALELTPRHAP